ncbi:MOSC domain-containing protein [Burkholderia ubonensis]|uniref:MOSC domain-containing protein n=1 Tax=Burkholderia ubonensis TaxID=101571 RepID=UPI00075D3B1D|nr:MOSC domain-containing protein [Burkholderia ubonensis]KVX80892.1 hypothetical protein WL08_12525 [Burkholderia ubonensis]
MMPISTIDSLFAGGTGYLPEGQRSGIFKQRITDSIRVEAFGLSGDEQADARVHGGPEKAIHHYAAENYEQLAQAFPDSASELVQGSLGENISARLLREQNVHIGDIFQVGSTVLLQVSQPRSPCWKINHRFGVDSMSVFVAQTRITGWYYRVINPGTIEPGDAIALVERQTDRFSIDQFWQVQLAYRPSVDDLDALSVVPGLAPDWKRRLNERVKWAQARSGQGA